MHSSLGSLSRWHFRVILSLFLTCKGRFNTFRIWPRYRFLSDFLGSSMKLCRLFASWSHDFLDMPLVRLCHGFSALVRLLSSVTMLVLISLCRTVAGKASLCTSRVGIIHVTYMDSAVNKDIIMTSKKLEQVETEANFPRIGRGMKLYTWIPRTTRGKKINPLELSYIDRAFSSSKFPAG